MFVIRRLGYRALVKGGDHVPKKATSPKAAKAASKVMKDGRTGKNSKTAAGSALSQREKPKKKKG